MSEKHANTPDVSAHRQLSDREDTALEAGKNRWLPRVFQSYGTPIPELMASPLKTGLIFGLPAGVIGAGLGSAIGGAATGKNNSGMGALIGGLGAGGLAAIAAGMDREAKNEGLEELMRRMPEGAAKRDLEADPQYQSDFLGWDNNKIVATARARYYRPTERFSKRTEDMADARSRYNERNKTSSVNKDVSMSQNEKQAMKPETQMLLNYLLRTGVLGSAVGGAAGAVTSKNKLRGMARGMLMGAGTGLGIGAGLPVGAGLGGGAVIGLTGAPKSYQGLSNVGNAATLGAGVGGTFGGMAGHAGGKALADALVGPAEDEDGNIPEKKKKEAHALLNNTTLTLAEKMAAYAELLKKSDAPAAGLPLGRSQVDPATFAALRAQRSRGQSAPSETMETLKHLVGYGNRRSTLYDETAKRVGQMNEGRKALGGSIGENVLYPASTGISNAAGVAANMTGNALSGLNKARIGAGNWLGENALYPAAKGLYNAPGALKDFGKWLKPDATPPGLLEQLKPYAPYAAVGGAGLGALALADYLSRGKKKKRRPEPTQNEEYDMPKAANVNWYQLTRERQKHANALTLARAGTSMIPYSRAGAYLSSMRSLLSSAAPYVTPTSGKALPFYAGMTLGDLSGSTGGFGVRGAISSLLKGKDPSMLQQIMQSKYTPYAAAGLGTAGLLGGAAYMGSNAGKNEAKKKKPVAEKKADLMSAGMGAGAGAGLGGLAGGLYGALAPGHEEDPETGRRRRRSRLMGALRGLAGGAAVGGLGGGAVGHFAGGNLQKILGDFLAKKQQAATSANKGLQTDSTMQADPIEVAKAEAMKQPAPSAMPAQGPTDFNATTGASVPPGPGLTNEMPPAPQTNPMPAQSPAAGLSQGPTNFNATMGGMPAQRPMM